jgi:hypothetical protein
MKMDKSIRMSFRVTDDCLLRITHFPVGDLVFKRSTISKQNRRGLGLQEGEPLRRNRVYSKAPKRSSYLE